MKEVLVHGSMKYRCEDCGEERIMLLEKGLEDPKQDAEYPSCHKPAPFVIRCPICSGSMMHVEWFNDVLLPDYDPVDIMNPAIDYFANKKGMDCGKPVFHDKKTVVNRRAFVERNKPCPCGSGKKYKRCCGR